ncbi:hypothetical protein C8Q70DRAFT_147730 [Cubamyces menziesii]|nr:hypothetical protein C8Q70DRAFT_147730 [Cubamyces menziesii]
MRCMRYQELRTLASWLRACTQSTQSYTDRPLLQDVESTIHRRRQTGKAIIVETRHHGHRAGTREPEPRPTGAPAREHRTGPMTSPSPIPNPKGGIRVPMARTSSATSVPESQSGSDSEGGTYQQRVAIGGNWGELRREDG